MTMLPPTWRFLGAITLLLVTSLALLVPGTVDARSPSAKDKQHAEAIAVGQRALDFYLRGEYRTAAELYRRAAQVEPDEFLFMVGVGRSERAAGRQDEAVAAFEEVLARAPSGHPQRAKAATALAELRAARAAEQGRVAASAGAPSTPVSVELASPPTAPLASPPAPPPTPGSVRGTSLERPDEKGDGATPLFAKLTAQPQEAPTGARIAGWSLVATGAVAGGAAAWLAIGAVADQRLLDGLHLPDGRFDLSQVTYPEALERQQSINRRWTGVGVLAAVFVAAEVVGIWLLVREDMPSARLSVGPSQLLLTGDF